MTDVGCWWWAWARSLTADEASALSSWAQTFILIATLVVSVFLASSSFRRDRREKRLERRITLYEAYVREGVAFLEDKHFLATESSSRTFVSFELASSLLQIEMGQSFSFASNLESHVARVTEEVKFGIPSPTPEGFLLKSRVMLEWVRTGTDKIVGTHPQLPGCASG